MEDATAPPRPPFRGALRRRIRVPRQLRLARGATHSCASRSPALPARYHDRPATRRHSPASHAPGARRLVTTSPAREARKLRQRTAKSIDGQTGKHPLAGQDRDTHRSGRPLPVLIVADTKRFGRHRGSAEPGAVRDGGGAGLQLRRRRTARRLRSLYSVRGARTGRSGSLRVAPQRD